MKSISKYRQNGFAIVSAIFILIILSLIGTYIVSISTLNQESGAITTQGVRAYYAAKSGLEWGTYKVAPSSTSGGAPPYNCPASPTTLTFTQGGLNNLSATVICTSSSFNEDGQSYNVFQLNSTGQFSTAGNSDYASRQLYATIIQPGI